MKNRIVCLLTGFIPLVAWVGIQGCGGDDSSTIDGGKDATTNPDASDMDTGVNDTGVPDDTGIGMDGSMGGDGGMDSGTGIAYACPDGGTVSSCSTCQGFPRPCVNCMIDGGALVAYCINLQGSCFPGNSTTIERCPCGDAGNCPEPYQVCRNVGIGLACRTCGESNTVNDTCQGGGMCRADGGCN